MCIIFLFPQSSYAFAFQRTLLREITSQNSLTTQHFHIYWSNTYKYTYPWLVKVDDYPLYINTLQKEAEKIYQSFVTQGFDMPLRIEIYVANTGIFADGLKTNSIASLGAFTSDIYPEILINADLQQKSLTEDIDSIVTHEIMHVVQYKNSILSSESEVNATKKWFTEGTAVAAEQLINNKIKDAQWYMDSLMQHLNEGFFSRIKVVDYANGFLFTYLVKTYDYSLKDFLLIYKQHPEPKEFLQAIAIQQKIDINIMIDNIYNSLLTDKFLDLTITPKNNLDHAIFGGAFYLKEKSIYSDFSLSHNHFMDYTQAEKFVSYPTQIQTNKADDINITINKETWNMLSLPLEIDDFSIFPQDTIIWQYDTLCNIWKYYTNISKYIVLQDQIPFQKITSLALNEGFWIKTSQNETLSLKAPKSTVKIKNIHKGWNLIGNILQNPIKLTLTNRIWKYSDKKWKNNVENNITISPYKGFWVYIPLFFKDN